MPIFLKIFPSCPSRPSWTKRHGSLRAFRVLRGQKDMVLFVSFASFVDTFVDSWYYLSFVSIFFHAYHIYAMTKGTRRLTTAIVRSVYSLLLLFTIVSEL
jgi:hypothetical protein